VTEEVFAIKTSYEKFNTNAKIWFLGIEIVMRRMRYVVEYCLLLLSSW